MGRRREVFRVEPHVTGCEQVQVAIPIVVSERASRRPAVEREARFFSQVREGSIAVVPIQPVLPVICDKDIRPAVIVVVPHADSLTPPIVGNPGAGGHIGKRPVAIVPKKRGPRRGLLPFERPVCRTVDEIYIQPTVIVVIEKSAARAGSFDDVVF